MIGTDTVNHASKFAALIARLRTEANKIKGREPFRILLPRPDKWLKSLAQTARLRQPCCGKAEKFLTLTRFPAILAMLEPERLEPLGA
jgi:hypothetical protein